MKSDTRIAIEICAKLYKIDYPFVSQNEPKDGRSLKDKYQPKLGNTKYPVISFRRRKLKIVQKVDVHRILAYQKYGDKIFEDGVICRHLNNNKNDFSYDNIVLGTALDNHNDNGPEVKTKFINLCEENGKKSRKLTEAQVIEMRNLHKNGESYSSLSLKFGIAKSTVSYIITNKTYKNI